MNIYKNLNDITKYIEDNIENEIDYKILAKYLGVNVYTMQRLFTMIAGITLSDYIRKRRLSMAAFDLYNTRSKVIDVAFKYQYENSTSFSRAFEKFHGIKPSKITRETKLKNFPRIVFDENIKMTSELDYEVMELDAFTLYGISADVTNSTIGKLAPIFFREIEDKYGIVDYGIITYDNIREESQKYYCAYIDKKENFEEIKIPKSKWLKFRINSQNPKDIQETSQKFYKEFLPSCKYNLKTIPELEYYHDGITDFLVAIY